MALSDLDKEILDRIDKFHAFYSHAWSKMLQVMGFAFVIIGIIIPAFFVLFQWRTFKYETEQVRKELRYEQAKYFLEKDKFVEDMVTVAISKELSITNALSFGMHGDSFTNDKLYAAGLACYIQAAIHYDRAGNKINAIKMLNAVIEDILPRLTKSDFKKKTDFQSLIEQTVNTMETLNTEGKYTNEINLIKDKLDEVMKN